MDDQYIWEEGTYKEDWVRYNPPPPHPVGPLLLAQPIQADKLCLSKCILLPKIIKPQLQASLPASITGMLPCPLGRVEHGSHRGWGEPHHNLHCKHCTCMAVKAAGAGFTCRLCICTAVWLRCGNTMVYHRFTCDK